MISQKLVNSQINLSINSKLVIEKNNVLPNKFSNNFTEKNQIKNQILEDKKFLTSSTQTFLETSKKFLDTYTLTVTVFGLLSTLLPELIALPAGLITGILPLLIKQNSITDKIKEKLSKIFTIPENIGKIFSYLPFKYPVIKANVQQKQEILSTLDKLPLKIVNNLSSIEINNQINDKYEALGLVFDKFYKTPVYLHSNPYPYTLEYVLTHEIGHTVDIGFKFLPLNYKSSLFLVPKYPWGIKNFISLYAESTSREDFAESFAHFFTDPQKLHQTSTYKYYFIKNTVKQNFLEKIFDNKFFRNLGKSISEFMSRFPVIRNVLDVCSFYASHKTISEGIEKLLEANEKNDKNQLIDSKFTLLSGLLLAQKSIYSLPLLPLKFLTKKILNSNKVKNSRFYEKIVDFIDKGLNVGLSFTIGPLGTSIYQALQTKSNTKHKLLVLFSGFSTYLAFQFLKFMFPPFIPIFSILQNSSSLLVTELLKRKFSTK